MTTSQFKTLEIYCTNCGLPFPDEDLPYRCPKCSGVFDYRSMALFQPTQVDPGLPGIWRYQQTFGFAENLPIISLGEGNTPLIWKSHNGREVGFKLEFLNPTGSYKDRGSTVLISFLKSRGILEAVEDSSGNAGASFAAYAAAAQIKAKVFVPDYASSPKRTQIEIYGSEIVRIVGTRSQVTEAALRAVNQGAIYASHAYLPFGLAGYATLAYEIFEQMGSAPGTIIVPVGQGNLLLAVGRGFRNLKKAGLIEKAPAIIGVQALACAPLWAVYRYGTEGLSWVGENDTLAEGVRVRHPIRGDEVLKMVNDSSGEIVAVDEPEIKPAQQNLAKMGLFVEPTSAIVWSAFNALQGLKEPIIMVLTGSGLKTG